MLQDNEDLVGTKDPKVVLGRWELRERRVSREQQGIEAHRDLMDRLVVEVLLEHLVQLDRLVNPDQPVT